MTRKLSWLWVLGAFIAIRLLGMALLPLQDTTEARYAAIARLMAESNDWITPWFAPGEPFWGKPPLSFWLQALAFKLLGYHEFSVRLPSLLATLGTLWLLWRLALGMGNRSVAQKALLIHFSMVLVFVAAGAVLTDPFLTLGVTWSLVAFWLAPGQPRWYWRYGFFIGLAIGVLAKGPLAGVLVFGPLVIWGLIYRKELAGQHIKALPWLSGSLLTLVLSLPWYLLAEWKTPGFLEYFIVGEHLLRFLEPGWEGDRYGSAHEYPKGTIWIHWLQASFPWGVLALAWVFGSLLPRKNRRDLLSVAVHPKYVYLLLWTLFTPSFFTLSGNVLWTYLLPTLPALALLMAMALEGSRGALARGISRFVPFLVPLALLAVTLYYAIHPNKLKTEKYLVAFVEESSPPGSTYPLYYLGNPPFSARYYSEEQAREITLKKLQRTERTTPVFLAIRDRQWKKLSRNPPLTMAKRFESQRYVLVEIPPNRPGGNR